MNICPLAILYRQWLHIVVHCQCRQCGVRVADYGTLLRMCTCGSGFLIWDAGISELYGPPSEASI